MIRVAVFDDHPVVREGVVSVLTAEPDLVVVGQAGSSVGAIQAVTMTPADVAILDLGMGNGDGFGLCAELAQRHPRLRVICLSSFASEPAMLGAFRAGARGFVVKDSDPLVLRQAVRAVAVGGTYIDPKVAGRLVAIATGGRRVRDSHGLTAAEQRVVQLLPQGLTNRRMARLLGVSEQTVKTHLSRAMAKLGVHNRHEVAALMVEERGA